MFRAQLLQTSKRLFTVSMRNNNAISELYLKELKSVKLPEVNIADANVKPFSPLKVSKFENDLSTGETALNSYESEPVEVLKAVQNAEEGEGASQGEDWLVIEDEVDEEHH